MPRTKVGGLRSAAGTTAVDANAVETVLPASKSGKFQFRSKATAFVLSLRRRRIMRGPDGEAVDEAPRSTLDNPLDWVRFEENNYETTDPEIAKLISEKPGYGLGLEFWALEDETAAHEKAYEDELRRMIAERPDAAKRILKPSDADDFNVPPAT